MNVGSDLSPPIFRCGSNVVALQKSLCFGIGGSDPTPQMLRCGLIEEFRLLKQKVVSSCLLDWCTLNLTSRVKRLLN
ncbi:hypothetical protein AVEN_88411-1 [Araneus ventricosus]|uniref:Uncharacterized protein n=1 Tax=Araneus ventricosus TaxID=182803 RepID=A0A4Y2PJS0_ARAVE|nr:hypothetical protein AVEN_88411-1 [Araneus ventricosus]